MFNAYIRRFVLSVCDRACVRFVIRGRLRLRLDGVINYRPQCVSGQPIICQWRPGVPDDRISVDSIERCRLQLCTGVRLSYTERYTHCRPVYSREYLRARKCIAKNVSSRRRRERLSGIGARLGMSRDLGAFRRNRSPLPSAYGDHRGEITDGRNFSRPLIRTKRDNLCARLTQVPRYFGSCHKISVLTTHARIPSQLVPPFPFTPWAGIERFLGTPRGPEEKRDRRWRERERERIEKPQISPSTARERTLC